MAIIHNQLANLGVNETPPVTPPVVAQPVQLNANVSLSPAMLALLAVGALLILS